MSREDPTPLPRGEVGGVRRPTVILLATRNVGKLRELRSLVEAAGWRSETLEEAGIVAHAAEEELEVHDTFSGNARAKAGYFAAQAPGRAVLAEDSGLCVEALGGAPGVYSKRWGGTPGMTGAALDTANCERLLRAMAGVTNRRASYVCAAVLCWGRGSVEAIGDTWGEILERPCGDQGFGYDPYFWSTELHACFGAVASEAKAQVSHRARAVRRVLAAAQKDFATGS